jgi:hypothetical protein
MIQIRREDVCCSFLFTFAPVVIDDVSKITLFIIHQRFTLMSTELRVDIHLRLQSQDVEIIQ